MAFDFEALEHDMVFLGENPTFEEISSIAKKWICNLQAKNNDRKELKEIIDNRENDITYLESELKKAKDRIADLEDELGK